MVQMNYVDEKYKKKIEQNMEKIFERQTISAFND